MRVIIWGTGGTAREFLDKKIFYRDYEIAAFTDNNPGMWGKTYFNQIPVISPGQLPLFKFDKVIICSLYEKEICRQLTEDLGVAREKIGSVADAEQEVCNKLLSKYRDCKNEEIQKILSYYKEKGFNIYGFYDGKTREKFPVERTRDHMPYLWFEGKKMYFPRSFNFSKENGREYVFDILQEQKKGSPHLYMREGQEIAKDSVIVDAGVCEGNFALRYIDRAKKVYLIESDPEWMDALERTFSDYRDKVVFCNKFLTSYDSADTITLDTLAAEKIDFLKMDIEGSEVDALLGGKNILRASDAACAICSYHRQNDEENIKSILHSYGYRTSTSDGYMFFPYDDRIGDTLDFRRGIVYGDRQNEKSNLR